VSTSTRASPRYAVLHRHPDVHHHQVRAELAALPHRVGAIAGLADHRDVRLGVQDHPESGAH
jgi:hypothetical protein